MSDKEKVLAVYPNAYCAQDKRTFAYFIYSGIAVLGGAATIRKAWQSAATHLKKGYE